MGRSLESKLKQKEASKAYNAESRQWCKENGVCIMCRKSKVHKNHTMCLDCLDQVKFASEVTRSEDSKIQRRKYIKRKRELCVAFGICRECMCREATHGLKCEKCKIKEKVKSLKNSKIEMRKSLGQCYYCDTEVVEGYKVCQSCLDRIRNVTSTRKQHSTENHYWRQLDRAGVRRTNKSKQNYNIRMLKSKYICEKMNQKADESRILK